MSSPEIFAFASYGNDSVALIQALHLCGQKNVVVVYSDTGWAHRAWARRVSDLRGWVEGLGYACAETSGVGLPNLVRGKKAWPRQGMQFCTEELKIKPALALMNKLDPERVAVAAVGVRRAESANRATFPAWREDSPVHGGRACWAPIVDFSDEARNLLLQFAGVPELPHRSGECFPCVNSNRQDLRALAKDEDRVREIEQLESELGLTSKGKPRTMFRPYRHMGAVGIRQVLNWAASERGQYRPEDLGQEACDGGFCSI